MDDHYPMIECFVIVSEGDTLQYEEETGLERRRDPLNWKDKERKLAKCEGRTYIGRKGNVVCGKIFEYVNSCCSHQCYNKFDYNAQLDLFSSFYASNKSKQVQDSFVASMITKIAQKSAKYGIDSPRRPNRWLYEVPIENVKVPTCQAFLLKVFQLSQKRIRVIQERLLQNDLTFTERRGKHVNRPHKLSNDVVELFYAHRNENTFPLPESCSTKKRLFQSFQDYYLDRTGKELKMKYNTFVRLSNQRR